MHESLKNYLLRTGYNAERKLTDVLALLLGFALVFVYGWMFPDLSLLGGIGLFLLPTGIAWFLIIVEYFQRREFTSTFYEDN